MYFQTSLLDVGKNFLAHREQKNKNKKITSRTIWLLCLNENGNQPIFSK